MPRGGDLGFVPRLGAQVGAPQLRDAALNTKLGSAAWWRARAAANVSPLRRGARDAGQRDPSVRRFAKTSRGRAESRKEQLLWTANLSGARSDADVVNYLARRGSRRRKAPSLARVAPTKASSGRPATRSRRVAETSAENTRACHFEGGLGSRSDARPGSGAPRQGQRPHRREPLSLGSILTAIGCASTIGRSNRVSGSTRCSTSRSAIDAT